MAIAAALGCDLSVRMFPGTGPRIRDRIQVAMSEALLASLHPRWRAAPEVPVYRPVRGVIDLVLADPAAHARRADGAAEPSCGASSSRSGGPCRRPTRWRRCPSSPATASAACSWCATRPPCARPSEPPPGHWPRPYPARAADAIASLTGEASVAWCRHGVGERRARRAHGSSMGRPAASRSGDSIVAVKKIGFLSFGHWSESPYSQVRTASDALLQSIELAVAAEELGADGAYFRVHHFARQLASPFPLLAADRRAHEADRDRHGRHRHALREPAVHGRGRGAADLIAGGRLQLGISRGSPEQVIDGFRYFGYAPAEGETDADMARRHAEVFLEVLKGEGFAEPNPRPMFPNPPGLLRLEPHSEGLRDRIWWGAAIERDGGLGREAGHEPAELDAQVRRERRAAPRPAAQADRGVPRGVEGGRPRARAARVGQPQHLRPGRRPGPRLLRARARTTRTRSATSTRTRARSSAGRTPRSPTCWSSSSPRTRRSPPPTRCC